MARLAPLEASTSSRENSVTNSTNDTLYRTPSVPPPPLHPAKAPSPNGGSDKENSQARRAEIRKGKIPAPNGQVARSSKRRRLGEHGQSTPHESASSSASGGEEFDDEQSESAIIPHAKQPHYDPNQDINERREIRKNYRELDKKMQDQRNEWMNPESRSLQAALLEQNVLFGKVKQTSDAIIDSRLLVNAGDMTMKRTKNLNAGESAQGIDLDEFVGKCMTFMRDGPGNEVSNTQRRRDVAAEDEDDEDDENQGNALSWGFLGSQACFPSNVRPPTISFMLGPLSVQKRVRAPTQRRERLQKSTQVEAVKAKELKASDLEKPENTGVASICRTIRILFKELQERGKAAVEEFFDRMDSGNITEAEAKEFQSRNYIMDDGGVHLFKFVIHPESYGQSSENLFYLSFLIKEDWIKIMFEEDTGLPSLRE